MFVFGFNTAFVEAFHEQSSRLMTTNKSIKYSLFGLLVDYLGGAAEAFGKLVTVKT